MESARGTPAKIDFRSLPLAPLLGAGGGGREGEMEEGERQREGGREREKDGGKERADGTMEEQKDNTDCRLESTFLPICSSVS